MRKFLSLISIIFIIKVNPTMGAEVGMPQLNPEFWLAQIFWLIFIFSILYVLVWKLILPRITDSIESRKKHIINDLDEAQKLKEIAEKKLIEYKKIIENSKKEAKKIILNNKKKFGSDIDKKRKQFESEVENEIANAEKQIKKFQQSSVNSINKIAIEISKEVIKNTVGAEVNISNLSAIVEEISKKESKKYL
mgnify:FL=1